MTASIPSTTHSILSPTGLSNAQAEQLGRSAFLAWALRQDTDNWQQAAQQALEQLAPPEIDNRVWSVYRQCLEQAQCFDPRRYALGSRRRFTH